MSLTEVAPGRLAAVVTYLEMRQRPELTVLTSPLALHRLLAPPLGTYRRLFQAIGARWLWFSRLVLDDDALAAIIHHPKVELYAVADSGDREAGMLELDFRTPDECEFAFVGLAPRLAGHGHGRWLLAEALRLAWRDGIARVHVHTCTLDHPAALAAYRRAGFVPIRRAVETFPDPRLAGILPPDCAPQVPGIAGSSAACV